MSVRQSEHWAADEAALNSFVDSLTHTGITSRFQDPTHYISPHEEAIMTQTEQSLSTTSKENNEELIDDSPSFPKFVRVKEGFGIGTCTGVVHAPPEKVLAYMYLTHTHLTREAHIATNGPDSSKYPHKTIHVVNDHHKINYSCRKLPPPLKPREWLIRHMFHQPKSNTIKYFATSIHDDDPDLPPSFSKTTLINIIRGEYSVIHEYKRLPHNQTKFTVWLKVDIKGSIPKKIANMGMKGLLDIVYEAYMYFQRDEEIDKLEVSLIERWQIINNIPS